MTCGRRKTILGLGLGTVLMVSALLVTVASIVCALGYNHLSFANRAHQAQCAQNAAESVVALAASRLLADPTYGSLAGLNQALTVDAGEAQGWLGFAPQMAGSDPRPASTNNLQSDNSVPGWQGQVVPGNAVRLLGVGSDGSVQRTIEAVIYIPPYPWSISSQGPFVSTGALLVASVASVGSTVLLPGNMVSNSAQAASITTAAAANITGDVQTCGSVNLSPQTQVSGQIRQHVAAATVPKLDLDDYDPQVQGKTYQDAPALMVDPILSGYVRCQGDLTIQGGVQLQGAVLFVAGNLTIEGGVRGQGAMFATGNTSLFGGSALSTDNQAAVVSHGDLMISGDGQQTSFFQGMIYTDGSLQTNQITLMGPLVSQGPQVNIQDTTLLAYPAYSQLQVTAGWTSFFFKTVNGELVVGNDRNQVVSLNVQVAPDGTYTVQDPATGLQSSGLTLAAAATWLETTAISHGNTPATQNLDTHPSVLKGLGGLVPTTPAPQPSPGGPAFTLDLNQFVPLQEKVRVLYWRSL